jgi:hypothetical protein
LIALDLRVIERVLLFGSIPSSSMLEVASAEVALGEPISSVIESVVQHFYSWLVFPFDLHPPTPGNGQGAQIRVLACSDFSRYRAFPVLVSVSPIADSESSCFRSFVRCVR